MSEQVCEELRAALLEASRARNQAAIDNVVADANGFLRPFSDDDIAALEWRMEAVVRATRLAGCDTSDLVGTEPATRGPRRERTARWRDRTRTPGVETAT